MKLSPIQAWKYGESRAIWFRRGKFKPSEVQVAEAVSTTLVLPMVIAHWLSRSEVGQGKAICLFFAGCGALTKAFHEAGQERSGIES